MKKKKNISICRIWCAVATKSENLTYFRTRIYKYIFKNVHCNISYYSSKLNQVTTKAFKSNKNYNNNVYVGYENQFQIIPKQTNQTLIEAWLVPRSVPNSLYCDDTIWHRLHCNFRGVDPTSKFLSHKYLRENSINLHVPWTSLAHIRSLFCASLQCHS